MKTLPQKGESVQPGGNSLGGCNFCSIRQVAMEAVEGAAGC